MLALRSWLVLLALALALAACGGDAPIDRGNATFSVRESIAQLHVTHAPPGHTLTVVAPSGAMVASGAVDQLGSLVFRKLAPGPGYLVRDAAATPVQERRGVTVLSVEASRPAPGSYAAQKVNPGFNYLTMRDGTTLSAYVTLPGPLENGPYPTVVNYSGYDPSRPGEPLNGGQYASLCSAVPALCDPPSDPTALIAALVGYATVGVNIRGTGCSGGAYDYFELLQKLDGYDVIEVIAAQPWVLGNKVGMTGLSYPGITQLFVAHQHPPHLAAITPLSVIAGTSSTLVPGGILNDGFAISWVTNVLDKAAPYGQGWERKRVAKGDLVCEENQLLHAQRVDNVQQAFDTPYYLPEVVGPLDPIRFVGDLDVPVFLAGAFQDEQTGPFSALLFDKLVKAPVRRLTAYNGVHIDGLAPAVLGQWKEFLDLYVAGRAPRTDALARFIAPEIFAGAFGTRLDWPPERFTGMTFAQAKAAFEAEPPVRILFENGAGKTGEPGAPVPAWERSFAAWPPPQTSARRLWLQPGGALGESAPGDAFAASVFTLDPAAGGRGILASGSVWDEQPHYRWSQPAPGSATVFVSEPLSADAVMVGPGSADLWLRSLAADDADLEVNLSEVRPELAEVFVQSGWLRASQRKLDPAASSALWPEQTHLEADVARLAPGEWVQARVGIAPFAHVFRAGSRVRLSIDTPGDSRADWRFRLATFPGVARYQIGHDAAHPSSVALPVLSGLAAPVSAPGCNALRGQQCRAYAPYANEAATP